MVDLLAALYRPDRPAVADVTRPCRVKPYEAVASINLARMDDDVQRLLAARKYDDALERLLDRTSSRCSAWR